MDLEFRIPSQKDDLLKPSLEYYYVKNTYSLEDISKLLLSVKSGLSSTNPFMIFEHFESFYAVLDNYVRMPHLNLFRSFDLLYNIIERFTAQLQEPLNVAELSNDLRDNYRNALKMLMYLYCTLIKVMDKSILTGDANKKSNKDGENVNLDNYEVKRYKCLIQIHAIIGFPLVKLWNPPVAEENFTNLFCDVCYATLEQNYFRQNRVGDTAFQILGIAVKRYNHAITLPVQLLRILRAYEHSIPFLVRGVKLLIEEFNITSILQILIDEIIDDLHIDQADTQTAKNFGIFLTDITIDSPKLMYSHLTLLSDKLLNSKSYNLRISILKMLGDVIVTELSSEELSEEDKATRDDFFEKLYDHTQDIHAFARAKVLHIFYQLQEQNAIPLLYQSRILQRATERLEDKTATVRKNALILIKTFLEKNPYSAKLTCQQLVTKYDAEIQKLEEINLKLAEFQKSSEVLTEQFNDFNEELISILITTRNVTHTLEEFKKLMEGDSIDLQEKMKLFLTNREFEKAVKLLQIIEQNAGNTEKLKELTAELYTQYCMFHLLDYYLGESNCKELKANYAAQEKTVEFLKDSINFTQIISDSVPKLTELLMSKTNTDVIEVIRVFTTGYLFGIRGIENGMTRILNLVWSTDKEKRDAVTQAYNRIFFVTDKEGKAHALKVVVNLSNFFNHLSCGYYKAFEILIKEWIDCGDINGQIIQVMFERFTLKLELTTEEEARKSLQLLVIASAAKSAIASVNIDIFETIGLKERGMEDYRVYNATLMLCMNLYERDSTPDVQKLEATHNIVATIVDTYKVIFFKREIKNFDAITMNAFKFIYHVTQTPDTITEDLLYDLIKLLEAESDKLEVDNQVLPSQSQSQSCSMQEGDMLKLPVYLMSRLLHLIGYIAMKEMIVLDNDVYKNIKYRQELHEQKQKKQTKRQTVNMNMSASHALKRLSGTATEQNEEEVSAGASADDRIAEMINHLCEKVILDSEQGIFRNFIPLVVDICKFPNRYDNCKLYQSAVLCLIRFMSVSSEFCEKNMPFLMNILTGTDNNAIKKNIIIGMTDFMFRFPNVIGVWSKTFYSMLHDGNDDVRLTTVKMLSYLIMQEMIKVKGQISDLALCIVDNNEVIRTTTQQFFKEIATKPNTLYNILPDVIARLGESSLDLDETKYQTVMKYIFGLVDKNRQVESLVDKLCFRFKITREERQWRDAVFCLSLLTHTDKTIRKLIDHIPLYKDKVQIDEVYNGFKTIIKNTTSKMAVAQPGSKDVRDLLKEFETKLDECLEVNGDERQREQASGEENSEGVSSTPSRNIQATPSQRKGRPAVKPRTATKSKPKPSASKKKRVEESDDDESVSDDSSDSSEEDAPAAKMKPPVGRAPRSRIVQRDSDSEDDSFQAQRSSRGSSGRSSRRR